MKFLMMLKKTLPLLPVIVWIAGGSMLTSCDRTRNDKGYEYFPDMGHSLAYETYSPNPVFKNGTTEQNPVPGTVNRDMLPYHYAANDTARKQAGKDLVCTMEATPANLSIGKEKFTIFCENCHGKQGLGDGYLYTSKRFTVKPASLVSPKMMNAPIGEIYHVITKGWGVMGAHGAQISPADRWRIALYVEKELQKKTN